MTLNAYPLAKADNPPKAEIINMSNLATPPTTPPNDYSYWEHLNDVVQAEPIEFIEPESRGLLTSIGIVKGQRSRRTRG